MFPQNLCLHVVQIHMQQDECCCLAHYFPRIQKVVLQFEIGLEIVKMFYVMEIEYAKI